MAFIEIHAARWVLPASLAINVFLATLIGVQFYGSPFQQPRPHMPPPPRGDRLVESMAAQVSPADGVVLREIFARIDPEMRRLHQNRVDLIREMYVIMGEARVDETALRTAINGMRVPNETQNQILGGAILEAAARLSPEGRRKLADWARVTDLAPPPPGPGRRGPDHPPGPPPGPPGFGPPEPR